MRIPYKSILLLVCLCSVCLSLRGQERVVKSIEKNYALTEAGKLQIQNEYGHLAVSSWEKDSVQIVVDIRVSHKKKENSQSLMDRVAPSFETGNDYINIKTEIKEKSQSFFSKYVIKETPLDFSKGNLEINYTIKLPKRVFLEIDNKFGDIVIEGWEGNLKATIEHGDLFLSQHVGQVDLFMSYGKIKGRNIDYGSVELKNGSLNLENAKKLRLNSRGSTIVLNKASNLDLYSNKDEVRLDSIDVLTGELKFASLILNNLNESVDLSMKISDFELTNVSNSDAIIRIKQEDSKIKLNISGISFSFDALLQEGLLRLPKTFQNIESRVVDKVNKIREVEASYGIPKKGRISIRGSKGVVILEETP